MYPHERSLVKKMEGKPFVLLGINSDRSKETLKKALADEKITWRSWYEGKTDGPIATTWNVRGWPTLYILDHKGVIRFKSLGARPFDDLVEQLVKDAEGPKKQ